MQDESSVSPAGGGSLSSQGEELAREPWMKWTTVRGFGSIKYFNISYVVLAVVPILHEVSLLHLFGLSSIGSVPVSLKLAYFASVLFALAMATYQYACPPEIKRFANPDEYLESQYEIFLRAHSQRRANIVLAHLDPTIDKEIIDRIKELLATLETPGNRDPDDVLKDLTRIVDANFHDAVQRYLLKAYHLNNTSRSILSWMSWLMFAAGSAILVGLLIVKSYNVLFDEGYTEMLLKTAIREDALQLDAYTYSMSEFFALEQTLQGVGAFAPHTALENDPSGRQGRRYTVVVGRIDALGQALGGQFSSQGQFTAVGVSGQQYACREIHPRGAGPGCENITASSDHVALTKCALIASNKNWFGGDAKRGLCKPRGGLLSRIFGD